MSRNFPAALAALAGAAALLAVVLTGLDRARAARDERLDWPMLSAAAAGGRYERAIALVDARLKDHPRDSLLYYFKAKLYYEAGRAPEALAEADRAIELGYAQEISHLLKGIIRGRLLGDYAGQRDLATKALSYDPTYQDAFLMRAEAGYWLGDYAACARDAAAFSSLSPGSAAGYETGLICHELAGEYDAAERAGRKALAMKPKSDAVFWRLGRIDAARGRHQAAIKNFSEAIRLSGGSPSYYLDRSSSCAAVRDYECEAFDYGAAMLWQGLTPYASHYYRLASAQYRAGEVEDALKAAGTAVAKEPGNAAYVELRGRLLAESGRKKEAAAAFRRAAELDPARRREAELLTRELENGRP